MTFDTPFVCLPRSLALRWWPSSRWAWYRRAKGDNLVRSGHKVCTLTTLQGREELFLADKQ
jgi:hypothetical protein